MRNVALCEALQRAGHTNESLAQAVGVDPKTVWRWQKSGRPPRRAETRRAVSDEVGVPIEELWPLRSVPAPEVDDGTCDEIAGAWATRAEVPRRLWWDLLAGASERIDLQAYAMVFLPEDHPDLPDLLADKANSGCRVRIALADPDCPEVADRDAEEDVAGGMPSRIRTTLHHFAGLHDVDGVEMRFHRTPLYNSIYRADDEMLVTPHLYALKGSRSPTLWVRRTVSRGLFDNWAGNLERVWATGTEVPSP